MAVTYNKLPGYHNENWNKWGENESLNVLLGENDSRGGRDNSHTWVSFDRFYSVNMQADEMSAKHYIFICRPDLFIYEEESEKRNGAKLSTISKTALDPYFQYLASFHPEILASLSLEFGGSGYSDYSKDSLSAIHKFIPYLTSRVESIQLPDYTIRQNNIVQPYSKFSVPYTTSANESSTGGSFDITFREDGQYSLHKMFYAWIYYQHNVMKNVFRPKDRYIKYNSMDYATSIYDFLVDHTGENIIYWSKYTGAMPTSVPMSDLSFNKGGTPPDKISIPFSYFYCEHMDQNILLDFNYNSLGYDYMEKLPASKKLNPPLKTIPIYNSAHFLERNLVGRPIIQAERCPVTNKPLYKLRFLD